MSLVRLSVKKAAYADLSRAAYRKSGAILGRDSRDEPVRQGRLKITQDAILGTSNSEMDHSRSGAANPCGTQSSTDAMRLHRQRPLDIENQDPFYVLAHLIVSRGKFSLAGKKRDEEMDDSDLYLIAGRRCCGADPARGDTGPVAGRYSRG